MRIPKALTGIGAETLGGIVEADEVFQRESRKGSREWVRHAPDAARYPKPPRHRWADYGRIRRRADLIPNLRPATVGGALFPRIRGDAAFCTDGAPHYRAFAQTAGLTHYTVAATPGRRVVARTFHIQNVNALHSRYREFLQTFRGPATKYLPGYLAWFIAQLRDVRHRGVDLTWDRLFAR